MFPILTDQREPVATTFAAPGEGRGFVANLASAAGDVWSDPGKYADIVKAADRQTMLTSTITSEMIAREEVFGKRIAKIKELTGATLENPAVGGYSLDARTRIKREMRANYDPHGGVIEGGVRGMQERIFEEKIAALRQQHPDLPEFGNADEEARTLAKGTVKASEAAAEGANPVAATIGSFLGGVSGMRRDPLFLGTMFAGPTMAAGKTALGRIASSAWTQGLFNAGVSAVEQPHVQDWRARIGMEAGIVPALEDVGMAFVAGVIPGAATQGLKEAARPLRRLLAGAPEAGDVAAAERALGKPDSPELAAALKSGEEAVAADRALLSAPRPRDVSPEMHDDLMGAALRRADDLDAASPEAVGATRPKDRPASTPEEADLDKRISDAAPEDERAAQGAADEALDDFGNRDGTTAVRAAVDSERTAEINARAARLANEPEKIPRGDPLGKVPFVRENGEPVMMTRKAITALAERDDMLSMLVRSCK